MRREKSIFGNWNDVCHIHAMPGSSANGPALVVMSDGSLRQIIALKGVNAMLSDEADREYLADKFAALACALDCDVQVVASSRNLPVDEYLSRYQMHVQTDDTFLLWLYDYTNKWFRRVQQVTFVPHREFYLVISWIPEDSKPVWNGRRTAEKHDESAEALDRRVQIAMEQMGASNLRPAIVTKQELREMLYRRLNPNLSQVEPEVPDERSNRSEITTLANSALSVHKENLCLDGKICGSFAISKLPHETWLGWLSELMAVNVDYYLSIFIHQCNQIEVREKLERDYRIGLVTTTQLNVPDLQGLEDVRLSASAIQEFLRSSNKAFDVSMYLSTQADSQKRLHKNLDELCQVFTNHGAIIDPCDFRQLDAWQATLPLGMDIPAQVHRVMSPVVGTMWPFFSATCGTPDGVPFGFAKASLEPVLLNPFYLGQGKDAHNMFVVGTTGAGKSFAISMLMLRLLPMGMEFVIVDKTVDRRGTYRFISEVLGPRHCSYIDIGPTTGNRINPFDLEPNATFDEAVAQKIPTLLVLLDAMLAPENAEELPLRQKALLDRLLKQTYAMCAKQRRVPIMSDLLSVVANAARSARNQAEYNMFAELADGISLYCGEGAYAGLVDGYTNIDMKRPIIMFDTRDVVDPRLERVAVFVLADFIRRRAVDCKNRRVRFAAIIDEAATLMRFRAGAKLLDDLSRRARHLNMMLVTITQ